MFHKESSKSAPAAVVGFQFQHSAMYTLFKNITGSCADSSCMNCASDDFECFVLDDNGYVIVSPEMSDTGKFFGEVRGFLMHHLVAERVYKQIIIYDYQAICFVGKDVFNIANKLLTVRSMAHFFGTWSNLFLAAALQIHLGTDTNYFKACLVVSYQCSVGKHLRLWILLVRKWIMWVKNCLSSIPK